MTIKQILERDAARYGELAVHHMRQSLKSQSPGAYRNRYDRARWYAILAARYAARSLQEG